MSHTGPARRPARRARGALAAIALLVAAGCASTWTPRTVEAPVAQQWPYPPLPAKVALVRSWSGFDPGATVSSAMRAVVYGRGKGDSNAFLLPVAVVVARDGRMAVADLGRRCVHLYVPAEKRYQRLVGDASARLVSPVGLAFDGDDTLWVADSAAGLFAFGKDGELRAHRTQAGEDALLRPTGLAYDAVTRRLFVVDTATSRVHALDAEGNLVASFGGRGDGEGQLNYPTHAYWSAARGELYVTDAMNFRISVFDGDGHPRGTFGRHGDGSGDLAMPKGVAVDADGVVYVADGLFDNVQLFSRAGKFLLTLGARGSELGEFWLPTGAFIDENGLLYVCDSYNRRVQVFRVTPHYQPAS
jgi:hypothetical protein